MNDTERLNLLTQNTEGNTIAALEVLDANPDLALGLRETWSYQGRTYELRPHTKAQGSMPGHASKWIRGFLKATGDYQMAFWMVKEIYETLAQTQGRTSDNIFKRFLDDYKSEVAALNDNIEKARRLKKKMPCKADMVQAIVYNNTMDRIAELKAQLPVLVDDDELIASQDEMEASKQWDSLQQENMVGRVPEHTEYGYAHCLNPTEAPDWVDSQSHPFRVMYHRLCSKDYLELSDVRDELMVKPAPFPLYPHMKILWALYRARKARWQRKAQGWRQLVPKPDSLVYKLQKRILATKTTGELGKIGSMLYEHGKKEKKLNGFSLSVIWATYREHKESLKLQRLEAEAKKNNDSNWECF